MTIVVYPHKKKVSLFGQSTRKIKFSVYFTWQEGYI